MQKRHTEDPDDLRQAVINAQLLMDIVNEPPEDESPENVENFTRFLDAMIELGKKLRGEATTATFVKSEEGEIVYRGLRQLPSGGFDSGYFNVGAQISSTVPGTTGVRKKPARGRLISNHIFYSVVKLDARRFRRCKICDRVFYASRLDANCCSTQHAKQYRTNEYRERKKENYQYKKTRGSK